jgi:hypothetical protein
MPIREYPPLCLSGTLAGEGLKRLGADRRPTTMIASPVERAQATERDGRSLVAGRDRAVSRGSGRRYSPATSFSITVARYSGLGRSKVVWLWYLN